jgi:hypothetical protein
MRFDIHVHTDGSSGPEILEEIKALREEVATMATNTAQAIEELRAQVFNVEEIQASAKLTLDRLVRMYEAAATEGMAAVLELNGRLKTSTDALSVAISGTPQEPGIPPGA